MRRELFPWTTHILSIFHAQAELTDAKVPSHFYSYSFALNPDWPRKYSMQPEIQAYFRAITDQYKIEPHIRFRSTVETAEWQEATASWHVTVKNHASGQTYTLRARALVSAVGSLSVPNACDIPGHEKFRGPLFHSAQWDNNFDWAGKDVVVVGNGCSATQFVPIMTGRGPHETTSTSAAPTPNAVKSLTQFSRQAHFLAERENPPYSALFKACMRHVPLAMRAYRAKIYADMERDFAGFDVASGAPIRADLKTTNEAYVRKMAPERYWEHLLPRHEIGCKRKVLDTDYLACLWRENMELVPDDPIEGIEEHGVRTRSGRFVRADAIVRATGFQTHKLLFPMTIRGRDGVSLEEHVSQTQPLYSLAAIAASNLWE